MSRQKYADLSPLQRRIADLDFTQVEIGRILHYSPVKIGRIIKRKDPRVLAVVSLLEAVPSLQRRSIAEKLMAPPQPDKVKTYPKPKITTDDDKIVAFLDALSAVSAVGATCSANPSSSKYAPALLAAKYAPIKCDSTRFSEEDFRQAMKILFLSGCIETGVVRRTILGSLIIGIKLTNDINVAHPHPDRASCVACVTHQFTSPQ